MTQLRDYKDALACQVDILNFVRQEVKHGDPTAMRWVQARYETYGAKAAAPSAVAWTHAVEDVLNAPSIWVTEDMYTLTRSVASDFDISEPFVPFDPDLFLPRGHVVLPQPYIAHDIHGKTSSWRAMTWALMNPGCIVTADDEERFAYTYNLNADGVRDEPCIRMLLWAWHLDNDDYVQDGEWIGEQGLGLLPWTCMHATCIPITLISRLGDVTGEGDQDATWLRWWRVLNRVMGQRIITTDRKRPTRPYRRAAERAMLKEPSHVIVVELRRPRQTRDEDDLETEEIPAKGHVLTHRHIRSEHWRNQWYPSINDHRQILIPQTVVGAEHLPLIIKRRVYNFDR